MMKQLFADMKIRHKLIVSGLALLIPLVVLLGMLLSEENTAIDFGNKEIAGVAYMAPLRALIEHVPQHRGFAYGYLSGNNAFKEKMVRTAAKVEDDVTKMDAVDQQYGEMLGTSRLWNDLKRDWKALKNETLSVSAEESFSRHTVFIKALIAFIQKVGAQSNLILDPDLDSYYLMDAVVLKLPVITEHIDRLRSLGTVSAMRNEISGDEKIELLLLDGGIEALEEGLSAGIAAAVDANVALRGIQSTTEDAIRKLQNFEKILQDKIENEGFLNVNPQRYFDEGTEVINAFFHLYDETAPALTGLLKARVAGLRSKEHKQVTGAMICIIIAFLIGFYTIRVISNPLREMTRAVQKIAKGDLSPEIRPYGRDEVGLLSQGFSAMLEGLKGAEAQKGRMAQVSAMVENADANFVFADQDFKVTYMNPASLTTFQKLTAFLPCAADEIVGQSIDTLLNDPSSTRRLLSDSKNLPYTATVTLGDEIVEFTAVAIYDHNKTRIGTMANWGLITDRARLRTSLKETTVSVASASEQLATASREMQTNAEHTTEKAQTVAGISHQTDQNVQSVAAAAEEMSVTVKEISKNVHNANQITEQAVEMAESMNETITKLDASNSEIGNVVKVISMIAGQTNLLALNATIEAARAGDAGKGFAVVANEVKELAKGTSKATDEIRQQIVAIQSNTKGAIESIEKITEIIKENNSITTSIASAVEQQSMTTNEISLNMSEAAKETKQIVEELEEIISTSQNTASSAVNIGEASEELSHTANHLSVLTEE